MSRPAAFILTLLALGALAQGSAVEDVVYGVCTTVFGEPAPDHHCHYQADGGGHGDASDRCADPYPATPIGTRTDGTIFPPVPPVENVPSEDPQDNYAIDVGLSRVNAPIYVTILPGTRWSPLDEGPVAYEAAVFGPIGPAGCLTPLAGTGAAQAPWRGSTFSFTPAVAGTYTLQTTVSAIHLAKLESQIPVACHFMCFHEVNHLVGYRINVNDTPP